MLSYPLLNICKQCNIPNVMVSNIVLEAFCGKNELVVTNNSMSSWHCITLRIVFGRVANSAKPTNINRSPRNIFRVIALATLCYLPTIVYSTRRLANMMGPKMCSLWVVAYICRVLLETLAKCA